MPVSNEDDPLLFLVISKFRKAIIGCAKELWDKKIIAYHQEIVGQEELVKDVLSFPDVVTEDVDREDRFCFYGYDIYLTSRVPHVKVVVEWYADPERDWEVITAYETPRLKRGEKVLYRASGRRGRR
jgi:hypothetical protein